MVSRATLLLLAVVFALAVLSGPAFSASIGTKVLRGAAIGYAITRFAGPLDNAINTATLKHGMHSGLDTKVVPILSVGEKGYVGGAQVQGPRTLVNNVQAVFQYEKNFDGNQYRAKVLVPSASLNPAKLQRVEKVGVSAIIDVALDGKLRYQTVGTGIQAGDVIRGAAVLVAVKNAGDGMNKVLNTITFNQGLATKVVPMGSIGEKAYLGGAQVSASARTIDSVNAVWQYEDLFDGGKFRLKIVVPTTSSNPLKMKRVDGAGVTAIIDMALSNQKDVVQKRSSSNPIGGIFGSRDRDNDRNRTVNTGRKDNGNHTGWYIGQRQGRKHPWVDAKWQAKMNSLDQPDREPFVIWLDGRKDRDIKNFDKHYKDFLKQRR